MRKEIIEGHLGLLFALSVFSTSYEKGETGGQNFFFLNNKSHQIPSPNHPILSRDWRYPHFYRMQYTTPPIFKYQIPFSIWTASQSRQVLTFMATASGFPRMASITSGSRCFERRRQLWINGGVALRVKSSGLSVSCGFIAWNHKEKSLEITVRLVRESFFLMMMMQYLD